MNGCMVDVNRHMVDVNRHMVDINRHITGPIIDVKWTYERK